MIEDKFLKYCSLFDREVYDFYRQHRHKTAEGINEYRLYKKAVSGLIMEMIEMMYESEAGVYISGLGYFCNVIKKDKSKRGCRAQGLSPILRNKKVNRYFPYFFPDEEFKGWTMSGAFNSHIRENQEIFKPYKLYFGICESERIANMFANKLIQNKDYNI